MAKIRVYELAKELGLDNKEILAKLRALKIPVKGHMSVLPEEDLDTIKAALLQAEDEATKGGVEEKRVARGVIRRRARAAPAPSPEEEEAEEAAKVDLATLKRAARRRREEGEETAGKPDQEVLEEIPSEWAEEEPAKKKAARKKAKPKAKPAEAEEEPAAKEKKKPKTGKAAAKAEPETKKKAAAKKAEPAREKPAAEAAPPEKKAPPGPRKIYIKPVLRKTARAPEGEPIPIPGQKPPPRPAAGEAAKEAAASEEEARKKKRKKKKKGKAGEEETPELFGEIQPKKRLRRKIAFKMQSGMEGMEIADAEQMFMPSRKKVSSKKKAAKKTQITTPKAAKRIIRMGESITAMELARQLGVKASEILRSLKKEEVSVGQNEPLDADTAGIIASTYEYEVSQEVFDEKKVLGIEEEKKPANLKPRPPVVTVMGHVDHGKTSLLDTIRKTRVTEGEAGAITQHIGASVAVTGSGKITFIDTPGHEAFTEMRARGAKVTDIVVLVVAADDGIMPQTIEAANHAKAAGVPIVVAINKIDLPDANTQKVMQRLADIGLNPEEWGGETLTVKCSAKSGEGVPELLEAIILQAEMLELTADPDLPGKGLVIESRLDKGKGPVATVVVSEGTLKKGDQVLCGMHYGRIRAMADDRGKEVKKGGPSEPVEIMGLSGVPEPGEVIMAVGDEKKAKLVVEHRRIEQKKLETPLTAPAKVSLEDLMAQLEQGEVQNLNLILKADTHGSVEAIKASVEKLSGEEVKVQVILTGVGNINENDVLLASASQAVVIGFMVKAEASAAKLAQKERVQIRNYDIIYELIDDVKASLKGMLKPVFQEQVLGRAEVRKVFQIGRVGTVAGSYVTEGQIRRSALARVLRDHDTVYNGKFRSLKRVQDDVREVAQGLECGIGLENFNDVQEGDIIEAYELNEVRS